MSIIYPSGYPQFQNYSYPLFYTPVQPQIYSQYNTNSSISNWNNNNEEKHYEVTRKTSRKSIKGNKKYVLKE
jgi:hypothetical protein